MTIEELKKYKWFVATCKYEGIVGKKHCFTYDVDNLKQILYLIFDYPHKHYTFKYFEV